MSTMLCAWLRCAARTSSDAAPSSASSCRRGDCGVLLSSTPANRASATSVSRMPGFALEGHQVDSCRGEKPGQRFIHQLSVYLLLYYSRTMCFTYTIVLWCSAAAPTSAARGSRDC